MISFNQMFHLNSQFEKSNIYVFKIVFKILQRHSVQKYTLKKSGYRKLLYLLNQLFALPFLYIHEQRSSLWRCSLPS